jgi:vancomycin resistance protein YoaR
MVFQTYGLIIALIIAIIIILTAYIVAFERQYHNRVYPNVIISGQPVGGKTIEEIRAQLEEKNTPLSVLSLQLSSPETVATIPATLLQARYDTHLAAVQAFSIGRSGSFLSQFRERYLRGYVALPLTITWKQEEVSKIIDSVKPMIEQPVEDALFTFEQGKVTAFKPSHPGRVIDEKQLTSRIEATIETFDPQESDPIVIHIPTKTIDPSVTTEKINTLGIKERIGHGYSEFSGSIPGRIHNVALASSRINGVLIPPGALFSFNQTVGDISAATGYQSAYIIKDGRTVLGDGGGVCQVSTTLFRAAMDAGLPIVERHEHSYRVHYYEEGGFKPGLDATVFSPSDDFKFYNNTAGHILIQTSVDTENLTATFDLYGTSDGRKSEIYDHQIYGESAPPAPLYQDDPTLPVGVVKQVDFSSWGAHAVFKYKVTRGSETLTEQTFTSNYRPWQAVYLRGTKQ